MHSFIARLGVLVVALSLAVPQSDARRLGSGRSAGRQAPIARQHAAPPPAPRQQPLPAQPNPQPSRSQPGLARQSAPPAGRSGNQWGGMLGGALLGLGLGSLMSSGNRNVDAANQNPAAQSSGDNGDSSNATDAGQTRTSPAPAAEQPQESRLGSVILLAIVALAVIFLIRRLRARGSQRRF